MSIPRSVLGDGAAGSLADIRAISQAHRHVPRRPRLPACPPRGELLVVHQSPCGEARACDPDAVAFRAQKPRDRRITIPARHDRWPSPAWRRERPSLTSATFHPSPALKSAAVRPHLAHPGTADRASLRMDEERPPSPYVAVANGIDEWFFFLRLPALWRPKTSFETGP